LSEIEPRKPAPAPMRPVVQNWTMADFAGDLGKLGRGRDFERGKKMYAAAQCAVCHLFAGEGGNTGPDLTAAASRYNRRDLLEAIIDPNKGISEQYAVYHVMQFDGKKEVAGMIIDENNDHFKVLVDPLRGVTEMISKYRPPKRELLPVSPMPPGLLNTLSKEEILDLLAFIESGGNAGAAAFAK
jgi:putative heme-binding domain-containing protein